MVRQPQCRLSVGIETPTARTETFGRTRPARPRLEAGCAQSVTRYRAIAKMRRLAIVLSLARCNNPRLNDTSAREAHALFKDDRQVETLQPVWRPLPSVPVLHLERPWIFWRHLKS